MNGCVCTESLLRALGCPASVNNKIKALFSWGAGECLGSWAKILMQDADKKGRTHGKDYKDNMCSSRELIGHSH